MPGSASRPRCSATATTTERSSGGSPGRPFCRGRGSAAARPRGAPRHRYGRGKSPNYNRSMSTAATDMPGVGDLAPDFTLPGTPDGDPVSLSSFKGSKHVLLAFYVFDFSPG